MPTQRAGGGIAEIVVVAAIVIDLVLAARKCPALQAGESVDQPLIVEQARAATR